MSKKKKLKKKIKKAKRKVKKAKKRLHNLENEYYFDYCWNPITAGDPYA